MDEVKKKICREEIVLNASHESYVLAQNRTKNESQLTSTSRVNAITINYLCIFSSCPYNAIITWLLEMLCLQYFHNIFKF